MEAIRAAYRATVPYKLRLLLWSARRKRDTSPLEKKQSVAPVERKQQSRDPYARFTGAAVRNSDRVLDILSEEFSRTGPPDLLIAHETMATGLAGLRAARAFGIERRILDNTEYPRMSGTIGRGREVAKDPVASTLLDHFCVGIANQYDRIVTTSEGQADTLSEMGIHPPIRLLRNARLSGNVNPDTRIREDCGCEPGDVLLLYCNHIYPSGGAPEVLNALTLLPPNYRLCFLGEVHLADEEVETAMQKLDLGGRVTFRGLVDPVELIAYSSGADLALIPLRPDIPNHCHTLPNRVFESIAANNPIIAPSMIEVGRFVERHGIGLTFDDFAPETIAATIRRAAEMKAGCKFSDALSRAARELTWEREQEALVDLIPPDAERVLIIACKVIERNDRVHRLTKTLLDNGLSVTVAALSEPMPELRFERVRYVNVRG